MSAVRRAKRRGAKGARRPVRWIYGGNVRQFDEPLAPGEDPCAVVQRPLACVPFESATAFELVNGEADLDFMDANEATVTRVVGDLNLRSTMEIWDNVPPFDVMRFVPSYVRLGLLAVDNIQDGSAFQAPDLWYADPSEDAGWMWRAQLDMSPDFMQFGLGPSPNGLLFITRAMHLDVKVNRKVNREGGLFLCAQLGHYNPLNIPNTEFPAPDVHMIHDLRVLVLL